MSLLIDVVENAMADLDRPTAQEYRRFVIERLSGPLEDGLRLFLWRELAALDRVLGFREGA